MHEKAVIVSRVLAQISDRASLKSSIALRATH
jgi:hypothetical protein